MDYKNSAAELGASRTTTVSFNDNPESIRLEIPPDYDSQSGDYDNDFASNKNGRPRREAAPGAGQHMSSIAVDDDLSGGESYAQKSRRPRNVDRDGMTNGGFQGDDTPDGAARELMEMKKMGGSVGKYSPRDPDAVGLRHRRSKSQHQNGFDYYLQRHRKTSSAVEEPEEGGDNFLPSRDIKDMVRTMHVLATLKIRNSKKKLGSSKRSTGQEDEAGEEHEPTEEIGLPSAQDKTKGLAAKMDMIKEWGSASAVAYFLSYKKDEDGNGSYYPDEGKKSICNQAYKSLRDWAGAISYNISFWSPHFKDIEGQCGIATTTFFRFTRWLVKINFLVFLIFLGVLYVPQFLTWAQPSKSLFIEDQVLNTSSTQDVGLHQAMGCSAEYTKHVKNISDYTGIPVVLDIAKGTGLLEDTSIFYGRYSNLSATYQSDDGYYKVSTDFNMSLAYLLTMMISFLIIFIMVVKTSSKSVRSNILDIETSGIPYYSNAIFGGWDYCINIDKMANYKQKIILNHFQAKLEELEIQRLQSLKTKKEKVQLWAKRVLINILVVCILAGCFTAIYFTTDFLLEKQEEDLSEFMSLVVEFLPSMVITILNFIIPLVFIFLVELEEYSPGQSTGLTVVRAVFLRISLVGVLLFSIYYRLFHKRDRAPYTCPEEDGLLSNKTVTKCCGNPLWDISKKTSGTEKGSVKCWETYVGQQFYKLSIADFFNTCIIYFGACLIRKILYVKLKDRFWIISKLGLARFDLPVEVLDIVYTQTLCWVGMFFSPLLPFFCLIQTFLYFFTKKYILLKLCAPPKNAYRASRSYSFFQMVLLVTFTLICIIIGYMVRNIQPSKGCGPFRVYSSTEYVMFDAITDQVNSWPTVPKGIFNFFGTIGFFLPAFLILGIAIYFYWAATQGYKKMENILRDRLKSESYDKQFLLARVDEVIKMGQLSLPKEAEW